MTPAEVAAYWRELYGLTPEWEARLRAAIERAEACRTKRGG